MNIKFSEHSHVAYKIKKGWSVDQDTLQNFTLESNWWSLGGIKRSNTIRFLQKRSGLQWYAIECVPVLFVMTPGAQIVGNIKDYGSATQLLIQFMFWRANPTQFWSLAVSGAFTNVTA